ncbi:MAG: DUF5710 domain-containing protein [Polaromonas sp.]
MRVNLKVPFAEKDAVKALGARWDASRKIWYVQNVEDLKPYMRWMPQADGFAEESPSETGGRTRKMAKVEKPDAAAGVITTSAPRVHCGCDVLPWLDCVHTAPRP